MSGRRIGIHVFGTLAYLWIGLKVAALVLKRLSHAQWNVLAHTSKTGYVVVVLLAYAGLASMLDVSLVFAAFLAGFGILAGAPFLSDALNTLRDFSFAVFIPLYFAIFGCSLTSPRRFRCQYWRHSSLPCVH
jgi:K+:H+ antiporter